MARHTAVTLQAMDGGGDDEESGPTHFAAAVETHPEQVHLVKVFGPPAADGFPTLAGLAVSTAADSGRYSLGDVAQAIVFLNPSVTTLTPHSADASRLTSPERTRSPVCSSQSRRQGRRGIRAAR